MATEILVNDGGAPARILPFVAAVANISAGDAVAPQDVASSDATVQPLDTGESEYGFLGVALTDAAVGEICNVVTGRGVVCMVNCVNTAGGKNMMPSSTAGQLAVLTGTYTGDAVLRCAVTLEDNSGAGLTKCLLV